MDSGSLWDDLISRGIRMTAAGQLLRASPAAPAALLTDADRALIREHKTELLALVSRVLPANSWFVHFADGQRLAATFCPAVNAVEALDAYPLAIFVETVPHGWHTTPE
jgi:hypothetical protein